MATANMTHENPRQNNVLMEFLAKNAWALILVTSSVVAQWAVFGTRLDSLEHRVTTHEEILSDTRAQLAETQNQYSALEAKLEGIDENVNYIRSRLDQILRNN